MLVFPPWSGIFFKLAWCGYTLRVTSQASYSPEYITPTQKNHETQNVAGGERNGEVENKLKCYSGLEISMNDTNYLISSQHLPFRINTLR